MVEPIIITSHNMQPKRRLGALDIAYAGTASSSRFRGFFECSYNIIDIKNGKSSVDIKIVGGKRFPLSDLVERYKPYFESSFFGIASLN